MKQKELVVSLKDTLDKQSTLRSELTKKESLIEELRKEIEVKILFEQQVLVVATIIMVGTMGIYLNNFSYHYSDSFVILNIHIYIYI